jgi:hypothetical protein
MVRAFRSSVTGDSLTHYRLFLIEGLITLSVGVSAIFLMPASAVATKTWFRPKGWFTDREVGIVVNRVLRDDPDKGDMHNRQGITLKLLYKSLADYDMIPVSSNFACAVILSDIFTDHSNADLRPWPHMLHPDGHPNHLHHAIAPQPGFLDSKYSLDDQGIQTP